MTSLIIYLPLMAIFLSFLRIKTVELLCFNMFLLVFLSTINYYEVVMLRQYKTCSTFVQALYLLGYTLQNGFIFIEKFTLDVYLDFYSSQMLWLVSFISFTVHVYSTVYMRDDPRLNLFMVYLTIFTFFMLFYVVRLKLCSTFYRLGRNRNSKLFISKFLAHSTGSK